MIMPGLSHDLQGIGSCPWFSLAERGRMRHLSDGPEAHLSPTPCSPSLSRFFGDLSGNDRQYTAEIIILKQTGPLHYLGHLILSPDSHDMDPVADLFVLQLFYVSCHDIDTGVQCFFLTGFLDLVN